MKPQTGASKTVLFVDLDGTLIKSDILLESLLVLIKVNLLYILLLPYWLLKGKAHLKARISELTDISVELLPYNADFLDFLKEEKEKNREIILATATNKKFATKISQHLGIFSSVIYSDEHTNISGTNKLEAIRSYGYKDFSYAGNAPIDLKIFKYATTAIVVGANKRLEKKVSKLTNIEGVFRDKREPLNIFLRAIRIHQWVKNLLVFVPLVMAQLWDNNQAFLNVIVGFLSFGLAASSVYIMNDMLDLESDRNHPRKKNRPFASGELSLSAGFFSIVILIISCIFLALYLPIYFQYVLLFYFVLTFTYSVILKQYVLIDVITLASLYTIRIIAGAALVDVVPSFWLLAFSMFLFLSLALVKRCSELLALQSIGRSFADGRDYNVTDLAILSMMGVASGYVSVLVIAFFINSNDVILHYQNHLLLWLICPAIVYWISRLWLKTTRGEVDDDPIVFSVKDRGSRYIAAFVILIIIGAL